MDRNQIIGLVLLGLLFFIYYRFFLPEPQPVTSDPPVVEQQDTSAREVPVRDPDQKVAENYETEGDSIRRQQQLQEYGIFSNAASGNAEEIVLENELISLSFSTEGGKPSRIELKEFQTYEHNPLVLITPELSQYNLFVNYRGRRINLYDLFYTASSSTRTNPEGDTSRLEFTADLGGGKSVVQTYELGHSGYELIYSVKLNGLEGELESGNAVYEWTYQIPKTENDIAESRNKTTINYYTASGEFDGLSETSTSLEEETISEPLGWFAFKKKFFTSALITENKFANAYFRTNVDEADSSIVKSARAVVEIPVENFMNNEAGFKYYFGPNNFKIMKKVAPEFEENIYLGWPPVKWVNRFVIINIFHFLEKFMSNYGLIIFLLVLIIKTLLFPLSYKSYISMAKTKVLKPELDEIKEKHGGDMQKVQSEQMKLYQQVGVNPLSGCIPMLLQMPILFAMFYFFPNSIELRQESFLWAEDLSTYDSIIRWNFNIPLLGSHLSLFTLLMTASTILYTWSNNQVSSVQGPMKSMGYIMPVVFMFVLNSFPAALTYYYFLSNIITFGQQAVIRKFVDEDKIRAILDENKKRNVNKKKSKFQMRLEEAMKASDTNKKKAGK